MTIDLGLLSYLQPKVAKTAIFIQNYIPYRTISQQSPYKALATYLSDKALYQLQIKPNLLNIRIFGYKAYVRINKLLRLAKLVLRIAIGYLVDYEVYNIQRIQIPTNRRIIRVRNV